VAELGEERGRILRVGSRVSTKGMEIGMLRVQRAEAGEPVRQTNEESLCGKPARKARQELDKRWQSLWLPGAR
jgi:hypothetical protein